MKQKIVKPKNLIKVPHPPMVFNLEDRKFKKWWKSPVTIHDLMGM